MTRIFFVVGLWLAGLLSGQNGQSDRCSMVQSEVIRLTPDKDSVRIRAGPVNHATSNHFPFKFIDQSGK